MPHPRRLMLSMLAAGLLAAGCGGGDDEATTTEPAAEATATATEDAGTAEASAGRDTFVTTCGGCHRLSDAGTNGQIGPDLDEVAPNEAEVLSAIETGPGQMPENLLAGEQAQQVAEYVASAASP